MHRQLLRQEPELIAVIAKNEKVFKRWQKVHDFYDTPNIKWRYIRGSYSIMGIRFTMVFLIDDWYKLKSHPKLTRELSIRTKIETDIVRFFSTTECWKGKYRYIDLERREAS